MQHPNLFLLGAQQAGTSWLAGQMSRHPEIFFSDPAEPLLMGRKVPVTLQDYTAYLAKYFGPAGSQRYRAEGSANNFQSPQAPDRIRALVPETPKFIICLRQPVEKAVSFFLHNWQRDRYRPGITLTETLTPSGQLSPLASSRYAASIQRWLTAFPRENFLFLKHDDLFADPVNYLASVSAFLGLAPFSNPGQVRMEAGMDLQWNGDIASPVEPGPKDHPSISVHELQALQAVFQSDIHQTQGLTGLDLSDWLTLRLDKIASHDARRMALEARWI